MSHVARPSQNEGQKGVIDPKNLRVLVIDGKGSSRQTACTLLRECSYQVTPTKSAKEALQLLATLSAQGREPPFDLILKDHEPPSSSACRLLRKIAKTEHIRRIPVVVMSCLDDRDVVAKCLNLGATDFLVKPLRHNELRNIWTRVWWWRRQAAAQAVTPHALVAELGYSSFSQASSSASEETKCDDEEEPTSKEGSAPDGAGNGSNGNGSNGNGSNGSKEGNGTSRVEAKVHGAGNGNSGNGNGSSDNKNGNGNSATKNGHNGSNGNGASTTLVPERPGSCALVGTAEGKAKPLEQAQDHDQDEHQPPTGKGTGTSAFARYTGPSSSRKRSASDVGQVLSARETQTDSHPIQQDQQRSKSEAHRQRLQMRTANGASTPSTHTASEDTLHGQQPAAVGHVLTHALPRNHDFPGPAGSVSPAAAFAALNNMSRSVPHLQGHIPHWNGTHTASHVNPMTAQAQANHALHNAQQMQHSFSGLFPSTHYGLPSHVLQQLQQQHLVQLYAGGNSGSNHATPAAEGRAPSHAPPPQMHLYNQMAAEQLLAAEAVAAQRLHSAEGLANNSQYAMLVNSLLYQHLNQQQQQQQQQLQLSQHQQTPFNHHPAPVWRPPQYGSYPFTAPPSSAPDTSLVSGGGGNGTGTQHTNGTSGVRSHSHDHYRHRAAALDKYRKKRKNLKFSKTIRYESRKQLAQQRPRIKGQFVKHTKPVDGEQEEQTNGQSKADDRYWQDEYDDQDEVDDMDEEDECEGNDDMEAKMDNDVAAEEEADVVNSLRELRNPDRLGSAKLDTAVTIAQVGSHGHSLGSRGSHGHASISRSLSHRQASAENRVHTPEAAGHLQQFEEANNNGSGKNGSDSGSNSPDENGRRGKHGHGR